jgi:hypothetical protein
MVNNRILWWLGHHQKLLGSWFGFRQDKPFTILYGDTINTLIKDKGTTATFLDMKAAYNNILPDILDEKLKKVRVTPNL